MYDCHKVSTWDDIVSIFRYMGPEWYFRGQKDSAWGLTTNITRALKRTEGAHPYNTEKNILRRFIQVAHNHLSAVEIPQTLIEWLALMQHHGAPTRLLDWTRSPFVAAYFALEDAAPEGECAIWAVEGLWLQKVAEETIRTKGIPGFEEYRLNSEEWTDEAFEKLIIKRHLALVVPAVPQRLSKRLVAQQAVFLVPGDFRKSIVDNLAGAPDSKNKFVKFELPNAIRLQALYELQLMNITRATLFPGLDGFAQSLKYSLEAWAGEILPRLERRQHAPLPFLEFRWGAAEDKEN